MEVQTDFDLESGSTEEKTDSPAAAAQICQFYKEGKCRFGSECHNLHEGPINIINNTKHKKSKNEQKKNPKTSPKSMKTALDVIR